MPVLEYSQGQVSFFKSPLIHFLGMRMHIVWFTADAAMKQDTVWNDYSQTENSILETWDCISPLRQWESAGFQTLRSLIVLHWLLQKYVQSQNIKIQSITHYEKNPRISQIDAMFSRLVVSCRKCAASAGEIKRLKPEISARGNDWLVFFF